MFSDYGQQQAAAGQNQWQMQQGWQQSHQQQPQQSQQDMQLQQIQQMQQMQMQETLQEMQEIQMQETQMTQKSSSQLPSEVLANGQVFTGVVKQFDGSKGFGHIECEETKQLFGKDILLLRSYLYGQQVNQGDQVSFSVEQDVKGVKATNIQVVGGGVQAQQQWQHFDQMQQQSPDPAMQQQWQQQQMQMMPQMQMHGTGYETGRTQLPSSTLAGGQVFYGYVKQFDQTKGFGHIDCDEAKKLFGKDIFLLKSYLNGQQVAMGDQVSFSVEQDPKGLKASNIMVLSSGQRAQPQNDQVLMGIVKSFDFEKGYGFIDCPETLQVFGTDVFLLKSTLQGQQVNPGDQVQFTFDNRLGKGPVARDVTLLSGGALATPQGSAQPVSTNALAGSMSPEALAAVESGQIFAGTVKSYDDGKGFGFIDCPETQQIFSTDVFLLRSTLGGHVVIPGDQLQFNVRINPGRGPVAKEVTILSSGGGLSSGAMAQPSGAMAQPMGMQQTPKLHPLGGNEPSSGLTGSGDGQVLMGTIKSFDEAKGYGFIDCAETKQMYGNDVFVLKSMLGGCPVTAGDQVQFTYEERPGKGPVAKEVTILSSNAMGAQRGPKLHPGQAIAHPLSSMAPSMGSSSMAPSMGSMVTDQPFMGSVKSFDEQKGFGFIDCPETRQMFGTDVFLLRSVLAGHPVSPGDTVQFTFNLNGDKGPVAKDVIICSGGGMGGMGSSFGEGQTFMGTVKSYDTVKGFGFIDCPETQQIFSKDVFLLKSTLGGQLVNAGDQVQFTFNNTPGRGPVAKEVTVLSAGVMDGGFGAIRSGNMKQQNRAGPYSDGLQAGGFSRMQQMQQMQAL